MIGMQMIKAYFAAGIVVFIIDSLETIKYSYKSSVNIGAQINNGYLMRIRNHIIKLLSQNNTEIIFCYAFAEVMI